MGGFSAAIFHEFPCTFDQSITFRSPERYSGRGRGQATFQRTLFDRFIRGGVLRLGWKWFVGFTVWSSAWVLFNELAFARETAVEPTPATHAILAQVKAGETVHEAGELPKTLKVSKLLYVRTT